MLPKVRKLIYTTLILCGVCTLLSLDQASLPSKTCSLFNGKDLTNWQSFSAQKTKPDTALFHVENGLIRAYGKYQGYIVSKQSFKDYYKLSLDFRWNTDSITPRINNKRNSGVMYNVPTGMADELWPRGIQYQIKDKATGDFILMNNVTMKVNGQLIEAGKSVTAKRITDAEKAVGEWNKLEVIYDQGKCTQMLNGVLVNEGTEVSDKEGRIALMFEGFPIDFKNIVISVLK